MQIASCLSYNIAMIVVEQVSQHFCDFEAITLHSLCNLDYGVHLYSFDPSCILNLNCIVTLTPKTHHRSTYRLLQAKDLHKSSIRIHLITFPIKQFGFQISSISIQLDIQRTTQYFHECSVMNIQFWQIVVPAFGWWFGCTVC